MQALQVASRNVFMSSIRAGVIPTTSTHSMFSNPVRHATKKAQGSSRNGRDSAGKRLGPKVMDGEFVMPGNILVRQRGTSIHPGTDVICGRDYTLSAMSPGIVRFRKGKRRPGDKKRTFVCVEPVPDWRMPSVERKLRKMEAARYRGPILHAPR